MATLQKTFRYDGDPSASALSTVNLNFKIPTFEFVSVLKDGKPFPERNAISEHSVNLIRKLNDTSYTIAFPNELLVGHSDNSLKAFYTYLNNIGFTNNYPQLLDPLSAQLDTDITDETENLLGQMQQHALYTLSTASDKYQELRDRQAALTTGIALNEEERDNLEQDLINYIRKSIFIINKDLFTEAASQFRLAEPRFNEYALLFIIAHVTDLSSGQPKIKIVQDEFRAFLKANFEIGNAQSIKTLLKIIKDDLFDFPIAVPEITAVEIEGTFKIITPGNSEVSINDFEFFDLLVEYTIAPNSGNTQAILKNFDWSEIQQPTDNSVPFTFEPLITNFINSSIKVRVKAYEGSVIWENQYAVTNPELQNLKIEVPLLKPVVLTAEDEPQPSGGNKKLTGKVVKLTGECSLKNLTIVIQAKKANDSVWKIVGSATTDSSGNFSLPYPYGIYVAAQALVSLTPDSPADINVNSDAPHVAINETIADDFLYLLLKDVNCEAAKNEEETDCDCQDLKKSNRLPDQEELIKSDSYTQDIGGACINLSIPNRTLNEYAQVAIIRTSDPDVANYILSKDSKGNFVLEGGLTKIVRKPIDLGNPVYWQDAPDDHANLSIYQAVTVATGHILHYKIVTKADGYSMGELLYSLPLAPGQKKEIVMFEQTHTLMGSETQRLSQQESLAASLVNERDITNAITGNLSESSRGSSSATTGGVSAGLGLAGIIYGVAGVFGVSGGVANSHSTASQNSSRSLSEHFHEQMKNAINQNAQSYREMNASVITTVQEGQSYGVTTEVVANHNHCHSLTMMYFEVLRHYAIYQELSSVEECLFIPLLMTDFTRENIFKWRDVLASNLLPMPSETYLQPFTLVRSGRQHPLLKAFDAIERIKTNYENVDFPAGAYDNEIITNISGTVNLRVNLTRPKSRYDRIKSFPVVSNIVALDLFYNWLSTSLAWVATSPQAPIDKYITVDANFATKHPKDCIRIVKFDDQFMGDDVVDKNLWTAYAKILPFQGNVAKMLTAYFAGRLVSEWDDIYYNEMAPAIFQEILNQHAISISPMSISLSSPVKYKGGERLIRLNLRGSVGLKRNEIQNGIQIAFTRPPEFSNDLTTLFVEDITINYSTPHYNGILFSGYVGLDLFINPIPLLPTPENANEKRNPKKEDQYIAQKLIEHLNSNLEHYNRALLRNLDKERRYMLLDGFNIETYNDFGQSVGYRSLASVVKNELVGISGNSLIMPVAPGYKIDRTFVVAQPIEGEAESLNLFEHYKPLTPIPPYRISIPSKGVFAEAVQGACDACEKVKDNSSQDWDKFKTDEPTQINPVTVPVPTVTDWKAAFKDFATPIINIQNAPAAPAPGAGLAGVSDLLGKSDIFKDITGLDQNQKNAMQTYLSNQENAKAFAEMAKEIYMMGHNTDNSDKIADSIRNSPELTKEEKAQLLKDHFGQMVDGGQSKKAEQEEAAQNVKPSLTGAAVQAIGDGKPVKATNTDASGNTEAVEVGAGTSDMVLAEVLGTIPNLKQDNDNACWAFAATIMMSWKSNVVRTVEDVLKQADNGGSKYLDIYTAKQSLPADYKQGLIDNLGMVGEKPVADPSVQQFIDWVHNFGPLWLTTDSDAVDGKFSPHARILVKITGTGTADGIGTDFVLIDPSTGKRNPQGYNDFMKEYKQMVSDNNSVNPYIRVVHFKDAITGEGKGTPGPPWARHSISPISRSNNLAKKALQDIAYHKSRITNIAWNLNKDDFFDRLKEIVVNPEKVNQSTLGYCGPAVFLRVWVEIDPEGVVDFAVRMLETGVSFIGDRIVQAHSSVLAAPHSTAIHNPIAEWVIMSSIKNTEVDATGKPTSDLGTGKGELMDFLEATNLYSKVEHDNTLWGGEGDLEDINSVLQSKGDEVDIILAIDSNLLQDLNLGLLPGSDHWILLTSQFTPHTSDTDFWDFNYWCWTQEYFNGVINGIQFRLRVVDVIYAYRKKSFWYKLPGEAKEIGVGPDVSSLHVIGTIPVAGGFQIFKWDDHGNWTQVNGAAEKIDVKDDGKPVVVNTNGDIFEGTGTSFGPPMPKPISIHPTDPGKAIDVICGGDKKLYSAWYNAAYSSIGEKLFYWDGTAWIIHESLGVNAAIQPSGDMWCVHADGEIWRSKGRNQYGAYIWEKTPGKAKEIAIGTDGSIWIIGTGSNSGGYGIYKWNGTKWSQAEGGGVKIAVDSNGVPYIINSAGKIFQRKPVFPNLKV